MLRNDFVSNSSSSSFIVINTNGKDKTDDIKKSIKEMKSSQRIFPTDLAKYQFGWEHEITSDFLGKLNFIALQILYLKSRDMEVEAKNITYVKNNPATYKGRHKKYLHMVEDVCEDVFGFKFKLRNEIIKEYINNETGKISFVSVSYPYYIDHQSCALESSCMEMFDSMDDLINFLKYDSSYIEGGNDNE